MMTERRNFRRTEPEAAMTDERISDRVMDQAYGQRARGIQINWTATATIIALFTWTISGVWFAATQSAAITANHASETTAIASNNAAIAQLQANEKENDKQRVEILLHLSNMDQSLKDILNYGLPRNTQVLMPSGQPAGNTIINTAAPNPSPAIHPTVSSPN